jgi:hypothetical protein
MQEKEKFIFPEKEHITLPNYVLVRLDIELSNHHGVHNWWEHDRQINEVDRRTGMVAVAKEGRTQKSVEDWLQRFYTFEGYKVSVTEKDKKREIVATFGEEQFKVEVTETPRMFHVNVSKITPAVVNPQE